MQMCTECCAVEQGTKIYIDELGDEYEVCAVCGMPAEEVMKNYDEDYGVDR